MIIRIQLIAVSLVFIIFSLSAIAFYNYSYKKNLETTHKQMEVYLQKMSDLISEVDKQTDPGFSHYDYTSLKPYFNKPAFYTSDYPFLIDEEGNYLIHVFREGQRFPRERLNIIYSNPYKKGSFEYYERRNHKDHRIIVFFQKIEAYNAFVGIPVDFEEVILPLKRNQAVLILFVVIGSLLLLATLKYALKPLMLTINKIKSGLSKMALGEIASQITYNRKDEVGEIVTSLNSLIDGLRRTAKFASELGKNKLDAEFSPLSKNDNLGNSLINMRESLKHAAQEEAKRKQEDEQRNWLNSGLAKFGDILRQNNNNLQLLSDSITQNLVNYLDANQGGLFILNEERDEEPYLELLSAFAYNRKKFKSHTIQLGEGLVGNCAIEKQTIHLKEIPKEYIEITSGLGDAPPTSLLIAPLKMEEKVFGVIEIASFRDFKPHEIEFIEKIGENIASTLSAVKNSIRTTQLLEQSRQQSEEMAAQEEEMRQNMEEMQATQEEMARKSLEMEGMTNAINEALLFCELSEEGAFQHINTNFINALEFAKQELESKTISDFIHPNEINSFREAWNVVKSGETFKGTQKWVNRSQEEIYILCSITPAFDENGSIYKIFLLGQDVTESKQIEMKAQQQAEEIEQNLIELQAEQELSKERENEVTSLLQALDTTCLVTEFDPSGKILFINNKNVETLGDSKEEIEGKYHTELDFEAKTNPDKYQKFWTNLLSGITQKRVFSMTVKGKKVWISEHYTPIRDESGKVVKIINIGIDISESKEIELRLQSQIDELMQQLKKK